MSRAARHVVRSWLRWDEKPGRVVAAVQCQRCGKVASAALPLPLALNEVHTFVLTAKEKLPGKCSV